ncbi:hypothetical protein ABG768_006008, partial [Culter alburnus]
EDFNAEVSDYVKPHPQCMSPAGLMTVMRHSDTEDPLICCVNIHRVVALLESQRE